jgi:hypothetical protein
MERRFGRTATVLGLALLLATCGGDETAVGAPAPEFSLADLQGKVHRLADYRGRVVVLEWINPNCPFSRRHAEEGTMTRLTAAHDDVVWLAINSTAKGHRDFLTPPQHAAFDRQHGIDYPVLYDSDGKVGHAYGAATTPNMFVIDEGGTLIYRGAIDDDSYGSRPGKRQNYVGAALAAHAAGKAPDPATTSPYGCSVKYQG